MSFKGGGEEGEKGGPKGGVKKEWVKYEFHIFCKREG